jgi:hypothetical protein
MSLSEAAKQTGVSLATIRQWKAKARQAGDDWDVARQAAVIAQGGMGDMTGRILDDFALQFKRTIDDLEKATEMPPLSRADALVKLSDSYVKIMRAAAGSNTGRAKLAAALEMLELYSDFIQTRFPALASSFVETVEPFGEWLSKRYGST